LSGGGVCAPDQDRIYYCVQSPVSNYRGSGVYSMNRSTEETRAEEKQKEFLCPLSWSVHHNLASDGYIESTRCCHAGFLGMERERTISFLGIILRVLTLDVSVYNVNITN
jgi:hypothetical protein